MDKSIGILDRDYTLWVKELVKRYRGSQIKAAIKVNILLKQLNYEDTGKQQRDRTDTRKYPG